MYQSVVDSFIPFSKVFEGYLPFMYLDVKGLVTTGMGNLIDPISSAMSLPWLKADGTYASQGEIAQEWQAIKAKQDMKLRGGGAFKSVATLHLDENGIQQLIASKLFQMESSLVGKYPGFPNWPADAQLGLLSMAWAMGPKFNFPKFQAAVNAVYPDFVTAAQESHMNESGNPGLIPRNVANNVLFLNAADTLRNGGLLDQLIWHPGQVAGNVATAVAQEGVAQVQQVGRVVARNPVKVAIAGAGIFGGLGYLVWKVMGGK